MKNQMYKILILSLAIISMSCSTNHRMLLAGSGTKKIVEIDITTRKVVWEHFLNKGEECNQVAYTREGHILYSHGTGAKLINKEQEILWSLKAEENSEIQSASITQEGNILIGQCGNPAKIIEFDSNGTPIREIKFDVEMKNPHGQFRRIMKLAVDDYWVVQLNGEILRMDSKGEITKRYKIGERAFDVAVVSKKLWAISLGDAHAIALYNPITNKVQTKIDGKNTKEIKLKYLAGWGQHKNGSLYLANWGGHSKDKRPQPQVLQFNKNFKVKWRFIDPNIGNISTIAIK